MTYLEPHKNKNRVSGTLIATGIMLIVVIATNILVPQFFPNIFSAIARPFWRLEYAGESGAFNSTQRLLAENEELKRVDQESALRLQTISSIEEENKILRQIAGRIQERPLTLASVLKRPPFTIYDELVIDLGRQDLVEPGSFIYSVGGVLIGRVSDVQKYTSKVLLFSSSGSKFEVIIGNDSVPATAMGKGGGQFEAKVPHESAVNEGDIVYDNIFGSPHFGIVTAKVFDPSQAFGTVLFSQPVNIYELRWVLVGNNRYE